MFKITFEFPILEFDREEYTRALQRALRRELKNALREWLRAVLVKVPTYTGAARGSLKPIGRFLNEHIPINPVPGARKRAPFGDEEPVLDFKEFDSDNNLRPNVKFDPGLLHYKINEFYNINLNEEFTRYGQLKNPGPWHSFEAGREAYREYLQKNLKKNIAQVVRFRIKTRLDKRRS